MTLTLTHQQRLNLIALIGAQRANVGDMRQFWQLQDMLALSDEEKQAISYRTATTEQGIEVPSWNPTIKMPPRDYELSDAQAQRIRRMVDEWPHFLTSADRAWIEPLVAQLPTAGAAQGQPTGMSM